MMRSSCPQNSKSKLQMASDALMTTLAAHELLEKYRDAFTTTEYLQEIDAIINNLKTIAHGIHNSKQMELRGNRGEK